MSAKVEWENAIEAAAKDAPKHLAADARWSWARRHVARTNKELHHRVIDEANQGRTKE